MSECIIEQRTIGFPSSPTSCLLQKETKQPPAVRGLASCRLGRSEGFELLLLFLFGRSLPSSRWLGSCRGCHESTRARKKQVWEQPLPRGNPLGVRKLGGTAVYSSSRCFSFFFFFFSPTETLNHVSAYPVIYIGRDSYQGGLQLPAQTHQPGHLFPTKSCPWEPQMRRFRSVGRVFHLWPEEEGFPRPEWSRVESGEDTIRRLGCTLFWRNCTELSS